MLGFVATDHQMSRICVKTLISLVTYVENLQRKLKDTVLSLQQKELTNYILAANSGT